MASKSDILMHLTLAIQERRGYTMTTSYTQSLLLGGAGRIGSKVIEEAAELVEASAITDESERDKQVIHEAADLTYHMMVLLEHCGLTFWQVEEELERRFGTSGLEEKTLRDPK